MVTSRPIKGTLLDGDYIRKGNKKERVRSLQIEIFIENNANLDTSISQPKHSKIRAKLF